MQKLAHSSRSILELGYSEGAPGCMIARLTCATPAPNFGRAIGIRRIMFLIRINGALTYLEHIDDSSHVSLAQLKDHLDPVVSVF